jgi:hypothetical protein
MVMLASSSASVSGAMSTLLLASFLVDHRPA